MNELKIEEILWVIFISISFLNLIGTKLEEDYLNTNNLNDKNTSDKIFTFTLIVTLCIYIYFFKRNISAYDLSNNKELYSIKVFGSIFLIIGVVCLIYFQSRQTNFIGSSLI